VGRGGGGDEGRERGASCWCGGCVLCHAQRRQVMPFHQILGMSVGELDLTVQLMPRVEAIKVSRQGRWSESNCIPRFAN